MAKSKEDIKYATAQAKLSEDEALRVGYVAGTPLEAGKISDSSGPVDLFAGATNISKAASESDHTISQTEPVDLFASARNVSSTQVGGVATKDEKLKQLPHPSSGEERDA